MSKNCKILILVLVLIIGAGFLFSHRILAEEGSSDDEMTRLKLQQEINEIDKEISAKQKHIDELNEQKAYYQKNIEIKRKEILNLNNQLSILQDSVTRTELTIKATKTEIDKTSLEIKNIELQIKKKENQIEEQKGKIAEVIRLINLADRKSLFEILLTNNSLTEFFNQIKNSEDLQKGLQKTLDKVEVVKQGLLVQKNDLDAKKSGLEELKTSLETKKEQLQDEKSLKQNLIAQTKGAEQKFQSILAEVQRERRAVNAEIANLEKKSREKLYQQKDLGGKLWTGGKLSWPVPNNGITCYFHDPDYPFRRWIGEHSGIDLRSPQGSPIYAPAPGYVARAKDAGMGFSYILLIHNNNISTMYGHVSKIYVKEDEFVTRGQVIGATGGMPGTPGAGRFSTGPHLHFEVRLNGIPVNPLDYLM